MTAPVSVVTPFYNTAELLAECIESVLPQTFDAFEYLLVDNCSTDGSGALAELYAARDPRLRVVRNDRLLPQVPNYNRALTLVSPGCRWVKVVQADDALYPRCLAEMLALAEAHPSIGVVSSYRIMGNLVLPSPGPARGTTFMTGRQARRTSLLDEMYLFGSPTTTLVRADLVAGRVPFYAEGRYFEDAEVIYELLRGADFGFVHQILSFTREQPGSTWDVMVANGARRLSSLTQVVRYGREVLSAEEHDRLLAASLDRYHRLLARGWLARRGPDFWRFHEKGVADIGLTIDRRAVARAGAAEVLEAASGPFQLSRGLGRFVRRLRGLRGPKV